MFTKLPQLQGIQKKQTEKERRLENLGALKSELSNLTVRKVALEKEIENLERQLDKI